MSLMYDKKGSSYITVSRSRGRIYFPYARVIIIVLLLLLTLQQHYDVVTSFPTTNVTKRRINSNNNIETQIVRHVKDVLCNGCRFSYSNSYKNTTCYYEIQQLIKQNPELNIIEAGNIIASYNKNSYCQRCHTNNGCNDNEKIYYRVDDVISSNSGYIEYATTHFLKSINSNDRIPHNVLMSDINNDNIFKDYISNPNNILPIREYYFEFNPSIVQLPKSQIPIQLLIDSGYQYIDTDRFYIASYRVSTGYHCFKRPEEIMIQYLNGVRVKLKDYLGIAILDKNLNILLETTVDVQGSVRTTIPGEGVVYQDGRLFNLNDQLYLGSFVKLYKIYINPPPEYPTNDNFFNIVRMSHYMKSEKKLYQVWTDEEEKYNKLPIYIYQKGYCSNDTIQQRSGKSLNYFYDNNINRIVMEIFPMGPKEYLHNDYCIYSNNTKVDFILPNQTLIPQQSYGTTDELEISYYNQTTLPYHSNRGNTCCLSIIDPRNNSNTLLIGISHKRTSPQKKPFRIYPLMYMNNFYAMESYAPYNIVARSGRFCFEFPNNNGTEMNFTYPMMEMNLQMGREQYINCPSIQFIMGMTEAIHDTNKVVISYGIDDCLSRFIIIDKQHIITLLFNPSNMIYNNNNNNNNNNISNSIHLIKENNE